MPWLLIRKVLEDELTMIIFYILNTFIIILVFGLTYSFDKILYPVILSSVILVGYLTIKYIKLKAITGEATNLKIANYSPDYNLNVTDNIYRYYR